MKLQPYFIISRDRKKEFRWALIASNGKSIAVSGESYQRRRDCLRGLLVVSKIADVAAIIDETGKELESP